MAFQTPAGEVDFVKVSRQGTQLSVLTKNLTTSSVSSILALLITDFASSFNVFTPMAPTQIADLAEEFAVEYWHYTLEDFVCFFQKAKKQEFKKIVHITENVFIDGARQEKTKVVDQGYIRITNRVDRGIILEMLEAYDRDRQEAFFQYETKGHTLEEKPLPPEWQEGEYSFADVLKCLGTGKDPEQFVHEKKMKEAGVEPAPDVVDKQAAILKLQVETFVKDLLTWPDARTRFHQPFYKLHPEEVERELKIQRKALKDAGK